jgi:hypothetical protein
MIACLPSPQSNDLAFLIRESFADYQARSKDHLTSHQLGDFRRCPALYRKKKLGLVDDEDRPAFLIGRALHTLVLEGRDTFEKEYAVGGPVNPKTNEVFGPTTKAFAEWAEAQGRPVLTLQQFDLVENMADGVRANGMAIDLLSEGIPEGVVRTDYCGMPCQIRMDWFDPHKAVLDLKTCDDLGYFEADARRYGYVHQLAFYRAVLRQVIGLVMPAFFLGIEKKEPFRCGVWRIHEDALAQAQRENEAAIERLKRCVVTDTWPNGYEDVRLFDAV